MGETLKTRRLSDAAGRCAAGGLAARSHLIAFLRDDRGATMIEYAILAGVLGMAVVAAIGAFQTVLFDLMNKAATAIETAIS
ncbi:MAG: Flp family type IVb pilin [Phenylobacterium sp.]|uniref:Flp family type IVb pilin n=1 Tax=Phenylobacterium sp. TaxID=1871053 RepID=UPI00271BA934|nr:Flp family type IVb pilin [Phenylobacterium sp.]MDO8910378.1 Flp family type IVb pilin [Phenylobacterium sp.]MDP3102357.1 Flp family type IVb pilin [Phenylobacterium sp.]HQT52048.1 Flp family type IVb pilin [Phenylobacterium sp.]